MQVAGALLDAGATVDARADNGYTALFYAAGTDNVEMARLLVERGAQTTIATEHGWTPLHEAADEAETEQTVELLLSLGADADARTSDGTSPAHRAASAAHEASALALIGAMEEPAQTTDSNGFSVLHAACTGGLLECVRVLLSQGADITQATADGFTALHYAASQVGARDSSPDVVRLLWDRGASLDAKSGDGQTPADLAFDPEEFAALFG